MLADDHRLRDSNAFRRTVRSGRRAGCRALVVHVLAPAAVVGVEPAPTRVGFVVSRAVGNAVVRNQVKRRLRHLVRDLLSQVEAGSEVVVRALPRAAHAGSAELGVELARCLDRAGRGPTASRTTGATT